MRLLWFLLLTLSACAGHPGPPERRVLPDDRPVDRPRPRQPRLVEEIVDKSFSYPLRQALDVPRTVRRLTGHAYEALDVDHFDQVPNSTWFTRRNGYRLLSPEEVGRGPGSSAGPDTGGVWQVLALKSAGVTPGMVIVDASARRYVLKFDPPLFPELSSGSEVVATRLFYAAGYNVPENSIAYLDPERLVPAPGATYRQASNDRRRPFGERALTREDIDLVLRRINPRGAQRIRVLASRYLPGQPCGPWAYLGVRPDDANDFYAHEHRRTVRGLYIVASWLNHADMKEENTLDMYDPQARHLRHYLIDFGAALGSNSTHPSNPRRGQANSFDLKDSLLRLVTLGLYVKDYERAPRTVHFGSVGYLENELFKPGAWKPMYPMPAFENLTRRDAFWGARIVTAFTDAQIGAAVGAGRFSSAEAAASLERFLRERRDRIGQYWFSRLNPLDEFRVQGDSLHFADLAINRGYAPPAQSRYLFVVRAPQGQVLAQGEVSLPALPLQATWSENEYISASLLPLRPDLQARPVLVYLRAPAGAWELAGLRRLD